MNIPLNVDWQQILLHLLNFVILATGLYLILYKPVKKFMDDRAAHFKELEEQAKKTAKEAEALKNEYAAKLAEAENEAAEIKARSEREGEESVRRIGEEARRKADDIISEAKSTAEREKKRMVAQAQKDIAGLVVEATEKLVAENSTPEHDKALYDQFIAAGKENENGK